MAPPASAGQQPLERRRAGAPPVPSTEFHARPASEALAALGADVEHGLSNEEAARRLREHGPNRLRRIQRRSVWLMVADQFRSIIVWLLGAAAMLSFVLVDWVEGIAILVVLAINAGIGFVTEIRATRSMEALRQMSRVPARVRREGAVMVIDAENLAPGDIALLEGGDVVTADGRLVEANNLYADESALTGESVPVLKRADPVPEDAPLPERASMVFKGTAITSGSSVVVVAATGMATELGRISALVEAAEPEHSPLEKRLDKLGQQLVWATLVITAVIAGVGIWSGQAPAAMLQTAIALAVAAVPEGLAIVATVTLARGLWRMARRNALIERLSAVETLGATTVILTDKTGTLTENRMTVVRLMLAGDPAGIEAGSGEGRSAFVRDGEPVDTQGDAPLSQALRIAALCNNAALSGAGDGDGTTKGIGDPTELALLAAAAKAGLEQEALSRQFPRVREEAFSAETKMMATFHRVDGRVWVAVKGAPEAVLARVVRQSAPDGERDLDERSRSDWLRRNEELAAQGLRVLALAEKEAADVDEAPYEALTFVGLVGLLDPPRADVAEAIEACRAAGVRVAMLTGDQAATARKVARDIGLVEREDAPVLEPKDLKNFASEADRRRLLDVRLFARVSPEVKLDLVSLHQAHGAVVAMTGDGVNDAPALRKADIGIAMGQRGTQVAREAAAMVLRDDSFPSIVAAMREGRVIFGNIRKFVIYLLSCNLSEIMVIGLATLAGLPLPLLPLQILYLNIVTDVFPAFALGFGEGDLAAMRRPPRDPKEPILGGRRWGMITIYAALITAASLTPFVLALEWLGRSHEQAITIAFVSIALGQLWHVFNMRDAGSGLLRNEVTRNPYIWVALALCLGLVLGGVILPGLSSVLGLADPGAEGWVLAAAASLFPLLAGQLLIGPVEALSARASARRDGPRPSARPVSQDE